MSLNTILATAPLTTTNYILKATGTTIGNSLIFDNGTNVGIGTTSPSFAAGSGLAISDATRSNLTLTDGTNIYNLFQQGIDAYTDLRTLGSIVWRNTVGNVERMRITSAGNVGIGTSSPETLLHVNKSNSGGEGGYLYLDNSAASATGNKAGIKFATSTGGTFTTIPTGEITNVIDNPADGASALTFGTFNGSSSGERMRITSGGNVLIGQNSDTSVRLAINGTTSDSSAYIFVGRDSGGNGKVYFRNDGQILFTSLGTGTVYSTGGVLSISSDKNLKIDDGIIDNALNKIMKLKPRYFYWKEESGLPTDLRQLGFYAQEVNQALGEEAANTPNENVSWGINDRSVIAMITAAIQEQQIQIQNLQEQINILAK